MSIHFLRDRTMIILHCTSGCCSLLDSMQWAMTPIIHQLAAWWKSSWISFLIPSFINTVLLRPSLWSHLGIVSCYYFYWRCAIFLAIVCFVYWCFFWGVVMGGNVTCFLMRFFLLEVWSDRNISFSWSLSCDKSCLCAFSVLINHSFICVAKVSIRPT